MQAREEPKNPPREIPTHKKPDEVKPFQDPDLSPDEDNPINPKSDEPTNEPKK